MREREAAKRQRGRCDPASSGRWCTSTRGWQPHPVLSRTRVKRNAFPGVYLTVPRYIRRMIDHQCFSTNAPFLIFPPCCFLPFSRFFLYRFIIAVVCVLNKRAKRFAENYEHHSITSHTRWRGKYNIYFIPLPPLCNYSFVFDAVEGNAMTELFSRVINIFVFVKTISYTSAY